MPKKWIVGCMASARVDGRRTASLAPRSARGAIVYEFGVAPCDPFEPEGAFKFIDAAQTGVVGTGADPESFRRNTSRGMKTYRKAAKMLGGVSPSDADPRGHASPACGPASTIA